MNFLNDPTIYGVYVTAKTIFIIADVLLVIGFVYALMKALHYRPHFSLHRPARKRRTLSLRNEVFRDRWGVAIKRFLEGTPEGARVAIIEADTIVDATLKQIGIQGEHMADRLERLSEEDVPSLPGLWKSHRTRNNLVHTPGYEISRDEARSVLKGYEAFLRDVGILYGNEQ